MTKDELITAVANLDRLKERVEGIENNAKIGNPDFKLPEDAKKHKQAVLQVIDILIEEVSDE